MKVVVESVFCVVFPRQGGLILWMEEISHRPIYSIGQGFRI